MLENHCQRQGQPWKSWDKGTALGGSDYFFGVFMDLHEGKFLEVRKHLFHLLLA